MKRASMIASLDIGANIKRLRESKGLSQEELAKDIPAVWDMLYKGSEEARAVAAQTLAEVKKAMKINYFEGR
jgi:transcriptional regulator with XRE-family HTH domain